MLRIEDGYIYLTRGDTAYLNVAITNQDGTAYVPRTIDTLTLTLKKNIADTVPALQKIADYSARFTLLPDDTRALDYGKYLFDVQLETAESEIFTVISKSNFYITEEVTA